MPFTSLLLTGLASNRLVKEHVSVAIRQDKKDNEIFLLFSSDKCDAFHKGYLKKLQKTEDEPSCCDAICFAQIENQNPKIIICFIELKGGDSEDEFSDAVDQITKTYERVKEGIIENFNFDFDTDNKIKQPKITWKALIVSKSSMLHQNKEQKLSDLRKKMGHKNVQYTSNSNINLTYFIKEGKISPPSST